MGYGITGGDLAGEREIEAHRHPRSSCRAGWPFRGHGLQAIDWLTDAGDKQTKSKMGEDVSR